MGSVTKSERLDKKSGRKTTVFRAYIRRAGVSRSKVFKTATEAKAWVRENEHQLALAESGRARTKTLAALIEDFVATPPMPGTKFWQAPHLEFWRDALGQLPVAEIKRGDVNGGLVTLLSKPAMRSTPGGPKLTGKTISTATANRYLASLSSVFNFALRTGVIEEHPMRGGKVQKLKEGTGRRRILSPQEEDRLMSAAAGSSWPMLHVFVRLCLTSAARKGEVLNLRWVDVNLDDSVAILPTSKNGRPRALPLVQDVRAALDEAKKVRPLHGDYVFFDPKKPTQPKNIDAEWKACRLKAGLLNDREDPLDRVVLHTTRHTAVTKMIKGGANLAQAAAVSGHQTLAMLKRYEHLAAADSVAIAERLLAGASNKPPAA